MRFITIIFGLLVATQSVAQDEWLVVADSVVRVTAGRNGGSGTLIYSDGQHGVICTAKHVIESATMAEARWRNGYVSHGRVLGVSDSSDVAMFAVTVPQSAVVMPVAEASESPTIGDTVDCLGYGGSPSQLMRFPARVRGYTQHEHRIVTDPGSVSGDSGGAIVYRGRLVGVIEGGELASFDGPSITTHGPDVVQIRDLLARVSPQSQHQYCPPGQICRPSNPTPPIRQPVPYSPPVPVPPTYQPPTSQPPPPAATQPTIDYDLLAKAVVAQLPPLRVHFLDGDNKIASEQTVPLGQVLTIPPARMQIRDGNQVFSQARPLGEPIKLRVEGLLDAGGK